MNPLSLALVAAVYALATTAATLALGEFVPLANGAKPRGGYSAHAACALGAAIAGVAIAARSPSIETLVITCIVVATLATVAYAGFFCDGIPVDVPIGAFAIVAIASIVHGYVEPLYAAAITGAPFLLTAFISPDKRSSLRDGTVAAIGGSILGFKFGVGATLLGSVAGLISFRGLPAGALARSYAPYLACAFGVGILAFALFG